MLSHINKEAIIITDDYFCNIQKASEGLSFCLKDVPKREKGKCLKEIIKRFKEQRFYSLSELNNLAEMELFVLRERLDRLVEQDVIKENTVDRISKSLNWSKDHSIEIASKMPIRQNQDTEYLPIVPVINSSALNVSLLMKLLVYDGKEGRSFVLPAKVKNNLEIGEKKCYWLIDARINEARCNSPFLTAAESIAYAIHNPSVLKKYVLDSGSSRYKNARNDSQIYLRLEDGYPILYWKRMDYFKPLKICQPLCALRLIH